MHDVRGSLIFYAASQFVRVGQRPQGSAMNTAAFICISVKKIVLACGVNMRNVGGSGGGGNVMGSV